MNAADIVQHKKHRAKQSGRSVEKKQKQPKKNERKNNPKAFAFASGVNANRAGQRNMDLEQKKLHVPLIDRTPIEPPPVVVAVVGPPQTGKTTLIKCLVKRYTKQSLSEIKGPVTVVAGKNRRITFIECSNDINAMIDVAKIADLVLMTIDASFGFEMETFEFLNILQTHGFPRIMGVLTHLDSPKFKTHNNGVKKLRKTKKKLKQRFWSEIYQGAKLFYFSGLINGKYPKTEILNLSRFISVMKFRPLIWRNTHPYMVADRFEDLTPEEQVHSSNKKCDRTISLYGYVRGTNLKESMRAHIPGLGDIDLHNISLLPDPCPSPSSNPDRKVKKRLDERQKLLHAPMSDVGGILYDKDAIYISVPGNFTKKEIGEDDEAALLEKTDGEKMVMNLQDASETLADRIGSSSIRLFSTSNPISGASAAENISEQQEFDHDSGRARRRAVFGDESEDENDGEEEDIDSEQDNEGSDGEFGNVRNADVADTVVEGDIEFADSDSDLGELDYDEDVSDGESDPDGEDFSDLRWKDNLVGKAAANFGKKRVNLMDLVYGDKNNDDKDESEKRTRVDSLFRVITKNNDSDARDIVDSTKQRIEELPLDIWEEDGNLEMLKSRFITGGIADNNEEGDEADENEEDGVYGDFEDLESGQVFKAEEQSEEAQDESEPIDEIQRKKEELKRKFDAEYDGVKFEDEGEKLNFYEETKQEMSKQLEINRQEFADESPETRAKIEGFRPGQYVRVIIKGVSPEFVDYFDPNYPIILGGLLPSEDKYGFVQVRIKRHRWHKKILKTNDPLIFSVGWRRFQSIPIYSLNDNSRNRMLKYTPEHMHCLATFFGPVTPPNTGFCCVQSAGEKTANFRIAATGVITEIDQQFCIVKKLKLTGVPYKIFKNTAFIKDMFSSSLEVAKFEGASIRTVSGIRGQVKRHMKTPEGAFRATFEDRILMSDIIFLRAWYPIKPRKYCNSVTNLLLPMESRSEWRGVRLLRDLRNSEKMPIPQKQDSMYRPINERPEKRTFNVLRIPKSIQRDLPFSSKPKLIVKRASNKPTYMQRRAVLLEPEEKKVYTLMQQLNTLKNEKVVMQKQKKLEKRTKFDKKKSAVEAKRLEKEKERKREFYRKQGIQESRKRQSESGAGNSAKRRK